MQRFACQLKNRMGRIILYLAVLKIIIIPFCGECGV